MERGWYLVALLLPCKPTIPSGGKLAGWCAGWLYLFSINNVL